MEWPSVDCRMGDHTLRFESSEDLPTDFATKALNELRETPQLKEEALVQLRKMIKDRGEIEMGLDDDVILLSFLRPCKYYTESAYQRMLSLYKLQVKYPKWFSNLLPATEVNPFKHNIVSVFPYRDQEGTRILLIQAGSKWETKEVSLTELIRAVLMLVMAATIEPKTQVAGGIVIIDLQGLALNHVWQFTPAIAKALLIYAQDCIPCRLKAVHIVNQSYIFNMLYAVFKPFINEKLRNRLFFHGSNFNKLSTQIDQKFLPTQYGGVLNFDPVYGKELHELLMEYQHLYKQASQNRIAIGS